MLRSQAALWRVDGQLGDVGVPDVVGREDRAVRQRGAGGAVRLARRAAAAPRRTLPAGRCAGVASSLRRRCARTRSRPPGAKARAARAGVKSGENCHKPDAGTARRAVPGQCQDALVTCGSTRTWPRRAAGCLRRTVWRTIGESSSLGADHEGAADRFRLSSQRCPCLPRPACVDRRARNGRVPRDDHLPLARAPGPRPGARARRAGRRPGRAGRDRQPERRPVRHRLLRGQRVRPGARARSTSG